jgi:hypothetical protein
MREKHNRQAKNSGTKCMSKNQEEHRRQSLGVDDEMITSMRKDLLLYHKIDGRCIIQNIIQEYIPVDR